MVVEQLNCLECSLDLEVISLTPSAWVRALYLRKGPERPLLYLSIWAGEEVRGGRRGGVSPLFRLEDPVFMTSSAAKGRKARPCSRNPIQDAALRESCPV